MNGLAEQTADAMAGFGEAPLSASAEQHVARPASKALPKSPAPVRIDPAVRAWSLSLIFHGSLIGLTIVALNVPRYLGRQNIVDSPLTLVLNNNQEPASLPDLPVPKQASDSISSQFSVVEQPEIPEPFEEEASDPAEQALANDFPTIRVLPGESAVSTLTARNAHPVVRSPFPQTENSPHSSRSDEAPPPQPAAPAYNAGASGPSGYVPPAPKSDIKPAYPASQKRLGRIATVGVELQIDALGRFTGLKVLTSSVHEDFIEAIRQAVQRAHFTPATQDGRPVASTLAVNFQFSLR